MNIEIMAIVAALASAVAWGAGDFGGGLSARHNDAYSVVLVSRLAGLIFLLLLLLIVREALPPTADLLLAAFGGILVTLALVQFYRELAGGRMGIVAPLTAVVTASVPVLFSAVTEGLPSASQIIGILLALLSIWLITRSGSHGKVSWRDLSVILLIGLLFSSFFIIVGTISERSVLWPLVTGRASSLIFILIIMITMRRQSLAIARRQLPLMVVTGLLDVGGSAFFAFSSSLGRLDIAAVLASLFPAVTVLLAKVVLDEQVSSRQWIGVAVALAAIILITL